MPTDVERAAPAAPRGAIRGPQSLIAGLTLIALALFAVWAISDLSQGTLRAMGPAMLPRWLAIGVGLCGAALVVLAFIKEGDALERWSLRGPVFVMSGIFAFALTIRVFGLVVAGPLAMIIGGFATPEVRWKEIVIFAAVMTAFCVGLFRYALNLPIPIFIIPGVYHF
jgi:hypothetical protein